MVFEKCVRFFPASFFSSITLIGKHMCGDQRVQEKTLANELLCLEIEERHIRLYLLRRTGGQKKESRRERSTTRVERRGGWDGEKIGWRRRVVDIHFISRLPAPAPAQTRTPSIMENCKYFNVQCSIMFNYFLCFVGANILMETVCWSENLWQVAFTFITIQ